MSTVFDVVIVGAGPAGCSVACHLMGKGVSNILLMDRSVFPKVKVCGGGITPRAQACLSEMGMTEAVKEKAYDVPLIWTVSPFGNVLRQGKKTNSMWVLERSTLDHLLVERVKALGGGVREGTSVKGLLEEGGAVRGLTTKEGERIRAKVVVVATGANGERLMKPSPSLQIIGYMGWFEGRQAETNTAFMIYDEDFLPMYGWIFPEGDERVNVGVCLEGAKANRREVKRCFDKLVSRYLGKHMPDAKPSGPERGYPIRSSYRIGNLVQGNVLLVGEAGRIVNPLSGEGITQALISGRLAADAISNYLRSGDAKELADYETNVRKEFSFFPKLRWLKAVLCRKAAWRVIEAWLGRREGLTF